MTSHSTQLRRRTARAVRTAFVLAVAGALVAGCSNSRSEPGADSSDQNTECDNSAYTDASIDWKQFSGETITVAALQHPWWSTVEPQIDCFEELTGITVDPSVLGEDQYVSKVAVELSAGASDPDVFMINQFGQAAGSGWLEPLDDYLANSELTDTAWYDSEDFFPGAWDFGKVDGGVVALPVTAEAQVLFIRDDLVPEAPTTMDELVAAAAAANKDGVAGFGSRAVAASNQTPWPFAGFSFSNGGQYVDAEGAPHFNSDENVAALTTYAELLSKYGPAGVAGWGYLENQQAMQQGTLAIWTDSSTFIGDLKDPAKTTNAEDINAYPFPSGTSGSSFPNAWYWTIGINAKSENKDASWLFMQWATSKALSEAGAENGASPARMSAWESDSIASTIGENNAAAIKEALVSVDSEPLSNAWKLTEWAEISDPLARAVNAAVGGADPRAELDEAQAAAEAVTK